jgi:hypothetical protein
MGDTTFNGLYGDNTTGDTKLGLPVLNPPSASVEAEEVQPRPLQQQQQQAPEAEAQHEDELLLSPGLSPVQREKGQGPAAEAAQPNWQAPAFLPPYAQKSQHTITSVRGTVGAEESWASMPRAMQCRRNYRIGPASCALFVLEFSEAMRGKQLRRLCRVFQSGCPLVPAGSPCVGPEPC